MFAAAAQIANNAVMTVYGQTVTVTVGAVSLDLSAVYLAPNSGNQNPTGSPYSRPDHQALFRTAELAAAGAREGDAVTIDGRSFYIANLEPDDGAMTTATLRPI